MKSVISSMNRSGCAFVKRYSFVFSLVFIVGTLGCREKDEILPVPEDTLQEVNNEIKPYSENQRYWQYNEEPILLLGASSDDNLFQWPEDDLISHLDSMSAAGANYVRNTMSDRRNSGFELYPFKQSENGKYDLDNWNEEYWNRFESFLEATEEREIIVQIEVWDRFDLWGEPWRSHPYNSINNVNYSSEEVGLAEDYPNHPASNEQLFFFSTPNQQNKEILLEYQKKFVEKMLSISLDFDHVLYCIDNETTAGEEWAIFWAEFIESKAAEKDKQVSITEMWGELDVTSEIHKRTFDNTELYSFCDISQNNWQSGQVHWDNFQWVRDYISSQPRPINTVKTYGREDDNNTLERWWRHVIGGAASARFHRPPHGLGLSEESVTAIKSARAIESYVKFWELEPGNELLSMREENEAYLTSKQGEAYVIYFTNGGAVGLDLSEFGSGFNVKWLRPDRAEWTTENSIDGGSIVEIITPENGSWIALITKN